MNKIKITDSQNFLQDSELVERLVSNSTITQNDQVIEIGPGKGIITKALAHIGCHVTAIELDEKLAKELDVLFAGNDNVEIVNLDFLKYDLPKTDYKVFANIPFNLTADIIQKLLASERTADDIYLIMQYEAIQKYSGAPYGQETLRSLINKPLYSVEITHEFSPSDFKPQPNANIALAWFHKKEIPDIECNDMQMFHDLINYIFSMPGSSFKEKTKKIFTYEQQKRICKINSFQMSATVSELSYRQWLNIFNSFKQFVSAEKKLIVNGEERRRDAERKLLDKVHRHRQQQKRKNRR